MVEFYATHKLLVWLVSIILAVGGCLVHYLCFGPHKVTVNRTTSVALVRRFWVRELISHWLMLIGFVILAITGIMQIVQSENIDPLGPFHGWLGAVFILISLITLISWVPDTLFRSYDWIWMRKMGGYLSRDHVSLPASRFNAGQKIYYWLLFIVLFGLMVSAIIMEQGSHSPIGRMELFWCIHGLLGCLATVMVIGHAYLSLFANPDTARVLWSGTVSKAYIDEFHPLWKVRS